MRQRKIDAGRSILGLAGGVILAAGLAMLAPGRSAAADDLVQEKATSEVHVTKDAKGFHIHTINRSYVYNSFVAATVEPSTMAGLLRQLITIEKTSAVTAPGDDDPQYEPSQIKVAVYPLTDKGKGPAKFTITATAESVDADSSYLTFTRPGCCVEYETKAVYSLETGAYLFNSTNDKWATLGAKGGFAMTRMAVVHVAPTESDDQVFGKVEHAGAVISYASPTAPLQRVMVILPKDAPDDTTLNWDGTLLWVSTEYPDGINHIYVERSDKPENVFTNATLRFKLDDQTAIEIPLEHDRLNVAAAKLPKGYQLKDMSLQ